MIGRDQRYAAFSAEVDGSVKTTGTQNYRWNRDRVGFAQASRLRFFATLYPSLKMVAVILHMQVCFEGMTGWSRSRPFILIVHIRSRSYTRMQPRHGDWGR